MVIEGLQLFSPDVQEKAEANLRQQDRVARHQQGVSDDTFFESAMDSVKAGFGAVSRWDWKTDPKGMRTALASLAESANRAAQAISDCEVQEVEPAEHEILAKTFRRSGNR
ncbi:MAG: hypothetical protein ACLQU2_03345 [Candidatus Binataceae bacterium]